MTRRTSGVPILDRGRPEVISVGTVTTSPPVGQETEHAEEQCGVTTLDPTTWLLLGCGALMVGFAKTSFGGAGSLAAVSFAAAVPARESTGALLPLLIAGDLLALALYRRHCQWGTLARLVPGVVPGLLLGAWFVAEADDGLMRVAIGTILLVMSVWQLLQRRTASGDETPRLGPLAVALVGVTAGFTTMTANAGGPVMTLYLLASGMLMLQLLGTVAWFFFVVNVLKVPFSAGLDLISPTSLAVDAVLVPVMLVGGGLGALLVRRISQLTFERGALALTAVAATLLLAG